MFTIIEDNKQLIIEQTFKIHIHKYYTYVYVVCSFKEQDKTLLRISIYDTYGRDVSNWLDKDIKDAVLDSINKIIV